MAEGAIGSGSGMMVMNCGDDGSESPGMVMVGGVVTVHVGGDGAGRTNHY